MLKVSWVIPLPRNKHHQDDITCLGSGIPINLHLPLLLGRETTPTSTPELHKKNHHPQSHFLKRKSLVMAFHMAFSTSGRGLTTSFLGCHSQPGLHLPVTRSWGRWSVPVQWAVVGRSIHRRSKLYNLKAPRLPMDGHSDAHFFSPERFLSSMRKSHAFFVCVCIYVELRHFRTEISWKSVGSQWILDCMVAASQGSLFVHIFNRQLYWIDHLVALYSFDSNDFLLDPFFSKKAFQSLVVVILGSFHLQDGATRRPLNTESTLPCCYSKERQFG